MKKHEIAICVVSMLATSCGSAVGDLDWSSASALSVFEVDGLDSHKRVLELLSAERSTNGAHYIIRSSSGIYYADLASRSDAFDFQVTDSDGTLLAFLQWQESGDVTLVNGRGYALHSTTGQLPRATETYRNFNQTALAIVGDECRTKLASLHAAEDDRGYGVVSAMLRPQPIFGAGGASCSSDDGTQTCVCKVGDRCRKGATFCKCESAYDVFGGIGGFGGFRMY